MKKAALIALRALLALALAVLCLAPLGCTDEEVDTAIDVVNALGKLSESQSGSSSNSSSSSKQDSSVSSSSDSSSSANSSKQQGDAYAYVFRSRSKLKDHYNKHGRDMGFKSPEDYEMAASAAATNPKALHKIEKEDGDDVYYVEKTNEFVVISTDGYIRTYFCPDGGKAYFNRQ